jgi:hypothetical protein
LNNFQQLSGERENPRSLDDPAGLG